MRRRLQPPRRSRRHAHDAELKVENISAPIDFIADYSAGRAVIADGDFNMRLRRETDRIQLERLEAATGLTA